MKIRRVSDVRCEGSALLLCPVERPLLLKKQCLDDGEDALTVRLRRMRVYCVPYDAQRRW